MIVTKFNMLLGRNAEMDLDVTQDQIDRWQAGELIQDVMPHLTADEREFLISGCLPGDFDILFPEDDDDDYDDYDGQPSEDQEWRDLHDDEDWDEPTEYDEWQSYDPDC